MTPDWSRRETLLFGGSTISVVLTGCVTTSTQSGESPKKSSETTTEKTTTDKATTDKTTTGGTTPNKMTTDSTSLTDWQRETDCEDDPARMYDSVIKVEEVTTTLGDDYFPIHFTDLSAEEATILRTVTEEGGYGTCDTSDAFHRFLDRVRDHGERQDNRNRIYLEREGTYYRLYVEKLDQVYAY